MSLPIAKTTCGQVKGRTRPDGLHSFLGIPYGRSTAGSRRFLPPLAALPWQGVRDAATFAPSCPQGTPTLPEDDPASTKKLDLPYSEDCLALNIWTRGVADGKKRAVMVWLHGGGFRVGSGSHPVTNGANLAAHGDVVVVSLNHRLNVFGFLQLDEMFGPAFAPSGNAGMLDIILALQWIKDNIAQFGGDPDNVTIFGESGGGRKVGTLMAMPGAKGLFHRAIIESGAHVRCISIETARDLAKRFCKFLNIAPGDVAALQNLPGSELFDQCVEFINKHINPELPGGAQGTWLLSPVVDGVHLPAHPWDPASEVGRDVPLMIGTNKDEAALTLAQAPGAGVMSEAELMTKIRAVLGDRAEAALVAHRKTRPKATPWELYATIASEDRRLLSIEIASAKAGQHGAPVYMYYFTWESNFGFFRAAHTMEIPFVFRNLDATSIVGTRPDRHALSDVVSGAWLAFARSGNPNHAAMPAWHPYDTRDRATMIFDTPTHLENDPRREERLAWGPEQVAMPWEGAAFLNVVNSSAMQRQRGGS